MFQVCIRATMYRAHSHWSGEVFQLKAIPLVKPKSMYGIFVIQFNNIVKDVETFRATIVIFFKNQGTNFWQTLVQHGWAIIFVCFDSALSQKVVHYTLFSSL